MIQFPEEIIRNYEHTKPAYERVYYIIRDSILGGQIVSNEKFTESKIAEVLHVSRTPVRAALEKLKNEGLLSEKRIGLQEYTQKEKEDLLYMLEVMESFAVGKGAGKTSRAEIVTQLYDIRKQILEVDCSKSGYGHEDVKRLRELDDHFHLIACGVCENMLIYQKITAYREILLRLRILTPKQTTHGIGTFFQTTLEPFRIRVIDALEHADAQRAEVFMACMVTASRGLYLSEE